LNIRDRSRCGFSGDRYVNSTAANLIAVLRSTDTAR
jgi:hypothetical protein